MPGSTSCSWSSPGRSREVTRGRMIRILRPTDSTRLLFFRPAAGGTLAFTLESATHPAAGSFRTGRYIARALTWRARRDGWIACGPSGIIGVAHLRHRSGPTAWELSELFLGADASVDTDGADILAEIAWVAARAGAQRVFLRLAAGSPTCTAARRAGYQLQTAETLYRRPRDLRGMAQPRRYPAESGWRPVLDADMLALFQLYCQTTPFAARTTGGLTAPEWRDALEAYSKSREMVLDREGKPAAWVRYSDSGNERLFTLMAQPEAFDDLGEVVRGVLAGGFGRPASVLVPAHLAAVGAALEAAGFVAGPEFDLYVRMTAVRATAAQPAVAAVGG